MRLRWKIALLVFCITLAAAGAGGVLCARQMQKFTLEAMADSEAEKLAAIGSAFRQAGTREDLEQMGELARDAYLSYQFDRCYPDGYGLMKDGVCIANKTDYEILNYQALEGEYMVQELDGARVFLLRQGLDYPAGFEVLSARDITSLWEEMSRQTGLFLTLAAGIGGAAALAASFFAGRMLKGLALLREGAQAIGRGELGYQVPVGGRDEVGVVSRAFNRMSAQIERQVEDLHLLLGALAHEMKTPVTSILGYGESLRSLRLSEEQKDRCAQQICQAAARMEKMSAKLMELIGLYKNDAIVWEQVRAEDLLERTCQACKEMLAAKSIHLQTECDAGVCLQGDAELLVSLLCNLVQNGCRASQKGGRMLLAGRVQGGEKGGFVFEVTDDGCGIAPEDLPKITRAFYMADKSRSRSEGGSGLGLALAERIAALHGARLEFASRLGEGTRVRVVFTKYLQAGEDFGEGK